MRIASHYEFATHRRRRMAALLEHAGQAESLMSPEELQAQRRRS